MPSSDLSKVRISPGDLQHIRQTFQDASLDANLYLFGSRTDPDARGGDIDLLILFRDQKDLKQFDRNLFLVEIKKRIGERRIDLVVALESGLDEDVFLKAIKDQIVRLV